MKAKTKGFVVFASMFLTACALVGSGITAHQSVQADMEAPDHYADTYNSGATIPVTTKKVKYNGKEYDADVIVIAPDGNAYRSENFQATQVGQYTVEYRITVDGALVKATEYFTVQKSLYTVSSSRSSAESTVYTYETTAGETVSLSGIDLTLASGDTFYYNKIIDLSDKTADDLVLGLFSIAQNAGTADLLKLRVTFTDVYDPTNTVTVELKGMDKGAVDGLHYSEYRSWMSAGASYQPSTGLDRNNNGDFLFNGNIYYKWVQHLEYGFPMTHSFYGTPYDANKQEFLPVGSEQMEIYWDYAERQIHGPHTTYNPTRLVADLDDSAFFNEVWQGFTTGEVTLSITGANYVSTSGRIFITDINGDDLTKNILSENDAPKITVDTNGYPKSELPTAKVNKPYRVFPATATDDYDGNTDVTVNVFYNYRTNNEVLVELTDGAFTPFAAGRYEIVYTAKDKMGKKAQVSYSVNAVKDKELAISLDKDDTAIYTVGKATSVPAYTIQNASGEWSCNVTATHKEKGIEYAVKDCTFIPMYSGEYTLVYAYGDYVESKTETLAITVENGDTPTILDELTGMPAYLLKNCIYELPALTGYTFENGEPTETTTVISVTENGKTRTLSGTHFAPQTSGTVVVAYTVTANNGKSFTKPFELAVVDVGYGERLHMENYFVGEVALEPTQQYVELVAKKDVSAQFATAMQVYSYESRLQVNASRNAFSRVTVRLQDTKDPTVTVAFHYTHSENGTLFSVNNEPFTYNTGKDCFTSELESITFNYSNVNKTATYDAATYVTVTKDEKGREFNGFTGDIAYVSFAFTGVQEGSEAGLRVYRINGQPFNKNLVDNIKPELFFIGKDSGLKKVGDRMYIAPVFVYDVLDPNVTVSFAVYDPSGNICTSEDGTVLNAEADHTKGYYVLAERLGTYMVRYQVCDSKGNKTTDSYALNVVDKEPPIITVSAPKATAKVGEKITLAKASAVDNVTEKVTVRVYVYYPDGHTAEIKEGSFTASLAGTYRVTYFAMDELMNTSFQAFTIVVS